MINLQRCVDQSTTIIQKHKSKTRKEINATGLKVKKLLNTVITRPN